MDFDSDDRPTEFAIEIQPKAEPVPLGFVLTFMAISLALAPAQTIKSLTQFDQQQPGNAFSTILTIGYVAISVWAIVNLVLLVKRSRRFPRAMIAFYGCSLLFMIVDFGSELPAATHSETLVLLGVFAVATVIAGLWIAYLVRSERVRKLFVR